MPLLSSQGLYCVRVFGVYDVYLYVSVDSFETGALWGCVAIQKYLDGVQNVNTSVWKAQEMT